MNEFEKEVQDRIRENYRNQELVRSGMEFIKSATVPKYCYNFSFLGRPIIQYPQDIVAVQELIWKVKPDLIIETGVAHGGSLIMSAAMLAILDMFDAMDAGALMDPNKSNRRVVGVDIEIRKHNRIAIESHPLASRIELIEGSSISTDTISRVRSIAKDYKRIMVCLDSNHTHSHVLAELEAYAPLTSIGSYCIVFDTIIEDLPNGTYSDRPWGPGDNPRTAVHEYLKTHKEFVIDKEIDQKLLISVAPDGYLQRVR